MAKEMLLKYGKEYLHDLETTCCKIEKLHLDFVRESIKALEQKDALDKAKAEIENTMKYQYATGDNQYAEGFEKSLEIINKYSTENKELTTDNDLEPEKDDYELE